MKLKFSFELSKKVCCLVIALLFFSMAIIYVNGEFMHTSEDITFLDASISEGMVDLSSIDDIQMKIEACPEGEVLYGIKNGERLCREASKKGIVNPITRGALYGHYGRRKSVFSNIKAPATEEGCPEGYSARLFRRAGYYRSYLCYKN